MVYIIEIIIAGWVTFVMTSVTSLFCKWMASRWFHKAIRVVENRHTRAVVEDRWLVEAGSNAIRAKMWAKRADRVPWMKWLYIRLE